MLDLAYPKPQRVKDRKFLDWVKTKRCPCRYHRGGELPPDAIFFLLMIIDPHHLKPHDDRSAVTCCRWAHTSLGSLPESEWREKIGFDKDMLWELNAVLNEEYDENKGNKD